MSLDKSSKSTPVGPLRDTGLSRRALRLRPAGRPAQETVSICRKDTITQLWGRLDAKQRAAVALYAERAAQGASPVPTGDEIAGMAWWNALPEAERASWLHRTRGGTTAEAWASFKAGGR